MNRPLLVTDCDEVLLHMVSHFADWLNEAHDVRFDLDNINWGTALSRGGQPIPTEEVWPLLNEFFQNEMHRQTLVPGVVEALGRGRPGGPPGPHPEEPDGGPPGPAPGAGGPPPAGPVRRLAQSSGARGTQGTGTDDPSARRT